MKFDQLLNLYWRKNFFISNFVIPFNTTLNNLRFTFGINKKIISIIIKKLELNIGWLEDEFSINILSWKKKRLVNIIFAKTYNVNFNLHELIRLNLIRLFLIKSYRGRCHILAKPVKSQQTWSNARSVSSHSKILKKNIAQMMKKYEKKVTTKKNYFIHIKKKVKRVVFKVKKISKLDSLLGTKKWF